MAVNERDAILKGKHPIDRDVIISGIAHMDKAAWVILKGVEERDAGADFILKGFNGIGRDFILDTKPDIERGFVLRAEDPVDSLVRYHFREEEISDFKLTSGKLINEITLKYAYDPAEGQFKASITKHNPLSKLLYGEARESRDLKMIQGTRQVDKVADAILMTSSSPEIKTSLRHDMRSFYIEVGDIVDVTHRAGLGENGYQNALALISLRRMQGIEILYEAKMKPSGSGLYMSELLTLTQTAQSGSPSGVTASYDRGVLTLTFFVILPGGQYGPPLEGAEITISGVKKITDRAGQVRFTLAPGTYTIRAECPGYATDEFQLTL